MLSNQRIVAFGLGFPTHLLGHTRLLFCSITLFLADTPFLVGYLLHLGIDALHHGRLFLLSGEFLELLLQFAVLFHLLLVKRIGPNGTSCAQQRSATGYQQNNSRPHNVQCFTSVSMPES